MANLIVAMIMMITETTMIIITPPSRGLGFADSAVAGRVFWFTAPKTRTCVSSA